MIEYMAYANIRYDEKRKELIIIASESITKLITFPIRDIFEIEFLSSKVEYLNEFEDSEGKFHKEVRRQTLIIPLEKEYLVELYFDAWKSRFIEQINNDIHPSNN